MNFLNNLGFKQKLFLLVLLPLVFCIYFSFVNLSGIINDKNQLSEAQEFLSLAVANNSLVHELQKERGTTAVFVGTQGKRFASKMKSQRRLTDQAYSKMTNVLGIFSSENNDVNNILSSIKSELSKLNSIRNQVNNLSISLGDALDYYTKQNSKMLNLTGYFVNLSPKETVKYSVAYYNFIEAKERAGIERAVVSGGFSKDKFSVASFQKFISLYAKQETYLEQFLANASSEIKLSYARKMNDKAIGEVNRMRNIAMTVGSQGPFHIDASFWFDNATKRINLLKEVEDQQSSDFLKRVNNLLAEANSGVMINITIVIVAITITIVVALYILKNLLRQLKEISSVMSAAKEQHNLSKRAQVLSSDELGQVAVAVNDTLTTFSAAIDQINSSSIELSTSAQQSATTISGNSQSIQQQRDETAQVATAIEEMSATVQEVSRNVSDAMTATHLVNDKAIESQIVVGDSLITISSLVDEVNQISELISDLHTTSSTISNVIGVIKGIADQTNLLALNAAIEAARAGDQGRGFAVVADEVRTLAQRTQSSTVEIESIINKLQREANNANTVISGSRERANKSIEGTHKIESALAEIVTAISDINLMIEQIASATEEQVMVTQEINQNVNDIDVKSQEVTTGAKEVAKVANNQVSLAGNLQTLASGFTI